MPATTNATRLVLFADGPRTAAGTASKIRRYRLARLELDASCRAGSAPRYEYLKRAHD